MVGMRRIQVSARLPGSKTIAMQVDGSGDAHSLRQMVCKITGIPADLQIVQYNGRTLREANPLESIFQGDNCEIFVILALKGGAAAKLKAEAERNRRLKEAEAERQQWFDIADKTEETGVMRLLIESEVLHKHKVKVHGPRPDWDHKCFASEPNVENYDDDYAKSTGYPRQKDYDDAIEELAVEFFKHWDPIYGGFHNLRDRVYPQSDAVDATTAISDAPVDEKPDEKPLTDTGNSDKKKEVQKKGFKDSEGNEYRLIKADGADGLWFKGPKEIKKLGSNGSEDKVVWSFVDEAKKKMVWADSHDTNCLRPPWMIDPANPDSEIERWIFGGIGTATYFQNEKITKNGTSINELVLWSQEDDGSGVLGGLTDREKLRLKQMSQIQQKVLNKLELTTEETTLRNEVIPLLVEEGPLHKPTKGIFQWRIKSLKRQLGEKCVFWQNTEPDFPGGSVAKVNESKVKNNMCKDSGYDAPPDPEVWAKDESKYENYLKEVIKGEGNEAFVFWKYGRPLGSLKKKHVRDDRQRFLDTIELYTPTFKAIIKNHGRPADENGDNSHQMAPKMMREITDIVALAMDLNLPDFREDKIACFVKSLIDKKLGPTWHVLVGRSFGFSLQTEARHFLHLHMQHLAVVVWKYEPDPPPLTETPEVDGQS